MLFLSSAACARTYSSEFQKSENPISEANNWINGAAGGASLWGNVRTRPGLAFGVNEPTLYGDPTAILTGAWGPDQTVEAIVHVGSLPLKKCCREVELRLRSTIKPGSITGYEAYCSVVPKNPYCNIARWNGPNGSYWNIVEVSGMYAKDGDVLVATAIGSNPTTITLLKNGIEVAQAIDTGAAGGGFGAFGPWTSGAPGIGFYDPSDSNWSDFGFRSFMASDTITSAIRGAFGNHPRGVSQKPRFFHKLHYTEIAVSAVITIFLAAFLIKRLH